MGLGRPGILVQRSEDHHVGLLKTRFQRPQDREAGVPPIPGADHPAGEQHVEQRRVRPGRQGIQAVRRFVEFGDEPGGGLARLSGPQAFGARLGVAGGQALGHVHVRSQEVPDGRLAGREDGGERFRRARQPRKHVFQVPFCAPGLHRRREAGDSRRRPGAAKDRALQVSDAGAKRRRRQSDGGQRVLEHGQQFHRRALFRHHPRGQAQERPGRRFRQRPAGRIVHHNVPAFQFPRHPPGERPVRRDQGRRLRRMLQHAAHHERDGSGLFLRARGIDAGDRRKGSLNGRRRLAIPLGRRRPQRAIDQGRALLRRTGHAGGRPRPNLMAAEAHALEQLRHAILRMGGLQRVPGRVVGAGVEPGKDQRAARQPGHRRQKSGGGRHAASRARGDDGVGGRRVLPRARLGLQEQIAPLGRVDAALFFENARPGFGEDREEPEGDFPVFGEAVGNQIRQAPEVEPLRVHLIEKARQLGRQPGRLIGRNALVAVHGADQAHQQQLPAQRRDGERDLGVGRERRLAGPVESQFVLVDVAQRHHPRQQQRPAAAPPQKRIGQRPAGATGGQQDRDGRQHGGLVADRRVYAGHQGVDEGQPGTDRIDLGGAFLR